MAIDHVAATHCLVSDFHRSRDSLTTSLCRRVAALQGQQKNGALVLSRV